MTTGLAVEQVVQFPLKKDAEHKIMNIKMRSTLRFNKHLRQHANKQFHHCQDYDEKTALDSFRWHV